MKERWELVGAGDIKLSSQNVLEYMVWTITWACVLPQKLKGFAILILLSALFSYSIFLFGFCMVEINFKIAEDLYV